MGVGLLTPNALPAPSRIAGFDKELRMKEALDDIYEKSSKKFSTGSQMVPDAIRMKLNSAALAESNNVTVTMMMELGGMGIYDPNTAIGRENRVQTKTLKVYHNIVRKVVTTPGYGNEARDAKPYSLYQKFVDQLAKWNKQHHGLSIRQALHEQFGESLVHGRTLANAQRNWSPNIFVAGLDRRVMQVPYNTNRAAYTTAIVNRIQTSGGGSMAPLVTQTLNMPNLTNAQILCIANRIEPLSLPVPGGKGWVLTMSEIQAGYFGDPTWSTRNLGSLFLGKASLSEKAMSWPGVMGIFKKFLLVEDLLQPTYIISGSSEPWGMTAGYMLPGNDDDRERDRAETRDTATILGKAAVIDWQADPLRFINQDDDYGMVDGRGTYKLEGVTMPIYNQENPASGTHEQYSSAQLILGLPQYV